MTVPIVFIHRGSGGDFNYLNYAALQARLSNPDTAIYVIGDQAALESLVVPAVELIPLEGLVDSGLPLRSVYEHYRVNSAEYTLFCMERWFYLRAFMEREGFQRALHLDCDVMLYTDVSRELGAVFDTCDLTLSLGHSTHTTSIRLTAVDRLCELMLATYRDSSKLGEIRDRWTKAEASGERWEGVGDMYFIKQLGLESDLVVRETYKGHDPVFDGNIRKGIGYEMEGGIKRIVFKAGKPYGFHEVDGREQRFATLHFQYTAKQHMPHFLHAPPGSQVPGEFLANALRVTGVRFGEAGSALVATRGAGLCSVEEIEKMSGKVAKLNQQRSQMLANLRKIGNSLDRVAGSAWLKAGSRLGVTKSGRMLSEISARLRSMQVESAGESDSGN